MQLPSFFCAVMGDRLIGKHKIEKRQYCHGFRLYDIVEHFIHPDTPLVCNIITFSKKKPRKLRFLFPLTNDFCNEKIHSMREQPDTSLETIGHSSAQTIPTSCCMQPDCLFSVSTFLILTVFALYYFPYR